MKNVFKERTKGRSPGVFIGKIVFGIIAVIGLAIIFGYLIMWLWNNLMPEIFGLSSITYWQAVGLFILSKILFSCGGHGGKHRGRHAHGRRAKHKFKSYYEKNCGGNFTEWEHYDEFWEKEGNSAYKEYVAKITKEKPSENNE